jgi:DNA-directed RNA polymerase subunit F
MLAWIFLFVVLAFVGKLVYDVQQNKKKPTQNEDGFDKDALQRLAGIKPTNPNDELRQILVKNNIIGKQQIIDALLKAAENSEFPKPDESINVQTTKIGTIDMKSYGDSDPLATIPMSRVSKEGKKKMAEIAKEDISKQLEEKTANIHPNDLNTLQMVLGDLGKMNDSVDTKGSTEIINAMINAPLVKPKRKYNKKPKK